MPYSSSSGKSLIDRALFRIKNSNVIKNFKILDVGVGSGTYSDLYQNKYFQRSNFQWIGIEIWKPYIEQFNLLEKYDQIINQDIKSFLEQTTDFYDIIFLGDVLEHMSQEDAIKVHNLALLKSSFVIVSIPLGHYPQGEFEGNPYEKHIKDDWSHEEVLKSFKDIIFWGKEAEIGVYISSSKHNEELKNELELLLKPKIGAYIICKNEEKFIERCYLSIKQADNIIIADTGSTDNTIKILEENIRKNFKKNIHKIINISVIPWRFDDAKNTALCSLDQDLDVCISIDADEILEQGWREKLSAIIELDLQTIGKVANRYNHRFSTIWNWDKEETPNQTDHWHERIHSRNNYTWKLPVHEILKFNGNKEEIRWLTDIKMIQKPDLSKSRSSYLPLLEKSIKEVDANWKTWSFYAGELATIGKLYEAIAAIKVAKQLPEADVAYLCSQLSGYYKWINETELAIQELQATTILAPKIREYKVYLANYYLELGRIPEAINSYEMALSIKDRSFGYEFNDNCWNGSIEKALSKLKVNHE